MEEKASSSKSIFRLACITAMLAWGLILLGGIVHGTGSSLACPDWPTCQGTFFPEMQGTVLIEHTHRLVAAFIGVLTIALTILCWAKGKSRLRNLSLIALGLVIFQGVLGGITVLYRLPTVVSTSHLAMSMVFFALLIWIAAMSYSHYPRILQKDPAKIKNNAKFWVFLSMSVVYFQMVWGALIRHLGAGLACVDIPLCQGSLWPSGSPILLKIHMVHRILAIAVALIIGIETFRIIKFSENRSFLRFLIILAPVLVLLQIAIGLWSIATALELIPVTAHLGIGALLWADQVLICFLVTREFGLQSETRASPSFQKMSPVSSPQVS